MKTEKEKNEELEKRKEVIKERANKFLTQILNNDDIVDLLEPILSGDDMTAILTEYAELSGKNPEAIRLICISNNYEYFKTYVTIDRDGKLRNSVRALEIAKEINKSDNPSEPYIGCISMISQNKFIVEKEAVVNRKILPYFTAVTEYNNRQEKYIFMLNIYIDKSIKEISDIVTMDLNL